MALKHSFLKTILAASLLICYTSAQGEGPTTATPEISGCQGVTCPANQECRLVNVQCFRAPCYPQPTCLDTTPACAPDPCVGLICLHGRAKDENGCILCGCNEPCHGVACSDGYNCEVRQDPTTKVYFGECVPTVTRRPCPMFKCSANCSMGYKLDADGCQMGCQCYDPCETYPCPENKRCTMTANDCAEGEECRDAPMPYCADISDLLPTSSSPADRNTPVCYPEYCTLNCSNGKVKDENGCERCECRVCEPDPCIGLICLYGKAKDENGCIVCGCYEPCFGVICPEGQECQYPRNETKPVGQCVLTVTRMPCQKVTCGSVQCQYGFLSDRNGCQTCECRDPCKGHQCPANQRCVVSGDDCPEGAECRDAPMPYCIDSSSTTILPMNGQSSTTNARGERGDEDVSLRQCCLNAGMSDSCLAVCSPNITLLYPNLETLSGCFQYLGAFLHCASGGRSHMNCCNQRGISESCLYLCTGNDTIDLSNPHAVTQCIVSSSQTVIGCFSEGLSDANMTVLSTSTPSSTTAEDICNLAPAVGMCRASIIKWYYSAKDRSCATFTYGGCGGNGNQFETRDDCLAKCSRPPSICPDVQCNSSCQITVDEFGCHTCSCVYDCFAKGCPEGQDCQMMPGSCPVNGTNCPRVPTCVPGPDTPCEAMDNCTISCPRGLMSGPNRCVICQCKEAPPPSCPPACAGLVCLYGRVKDSAGCDTCECFSPCQIANCSDQCREIRNNVTGLYSGECYSATTRPSTTAGTPSPKLSLCLVAPDYGLSCQSNTTRWFYNQSANACSSFTFGGCQGNDNNFQSKPVCELVCMDSTCPGDDCRVIQPYCPFGLKTDENGCSLCQCLDPCEGFECLGNTVCVSRKSDCADSGEACRDPFTRMCIDPITLISSTTAVLPRSQSTLPPSGGCPPVCLMYCIHGFEKDVNGCDICTCRDPCNNCTSDQTCVRMAIDCPMDDPRCANSNIGYCIDKSSTTSSPTPTSAAVTSSPMPSSSTMIKPPICLLCMMICPYGMLKGANGCPVCHCYNPCESVACMANNICQVFQNSSCSTGADNCPPNIKYQGQCVDTTIQTSTPTPSISSRPPTSGPVSCPHRQACSNSCPYGNGKDSNGCYTCECDDPCLRATCNSTQTCARESASGYCEEDMCWPTFKAVCRPMCTREVSCSTMNCSYGLEKGADGCDICQCFDPCKDVICAANEECAVTMGLSPAGYCTVRCPPMNDCTISCEFGYVKDSAGCKMCQCYDPCQSNSCAEGETCVPDKTPIYTGFVPERIYLSRCAVCQETMTCRMPCRYGFAKNMTTECEMCRCYEPCQNVTCPSGQMCSAKYQFNGRYLYVAECTADNTTQPVTNGPSSTTEGGPVTCGPVCMIYCTYGNVRDANGCKTCSCNPDPCADVVCRVNQKCVASTFENNGSSYGQCVECPLPMCASQCFYGTMIDPVTGCPACECRMDPCAAVRCQNAMCQTLLLCPDDNGCTPAPVCVDPNRPCDGLQKEYEKMFGNNVAKLPQLNCDSRGLFKPIQCSEYDCWCVDEYGNPMTNRSSMQLNCYPGMQMKETLKIEADINVIGVGDGWQFKQQVSQQLSNLLDIDESLVTIRKYVKGSIIADVVIGSGEEMDMTLLQRKLNLARQSSFDITYNNETYKAILLGGGTVTLMTVQPTTMAAAGDAGGNNILMIVLICVLVPIGLVGIAVTICVVCKVCKRQRMNPRRLSEKSSDAPTEIDSMESGSDKSYPSDKFSSAITKEEKVPPIDTTEA